MSRKSQQFDLSAVQENIIDGLKDTGKTARGASIEAGLGASTIRNILEGRSANPRIDTLGAIAKVLGMSPHFFLGMQDRDAVSDVDSKLVGKDLISKGLSLTKGADRLNNTIPLFAPLISGDSRIVLGSTFMTISRDAFKLNEDKRIFAIQIREKIYEPAYYMDDIIIIDPSLPNLPNNDYLFRDGSAAVGGIEGVTFHIIARLIDISTEEFTVKSFVTKKVVSLPRSKYIKADGIVGKAYRRS